MLNAKYRWIHTPVPKEEVQRLAQELECSFSMAAILWKRGFQDPVSAHAFLAPKLANLSDPLSIAGVAEAVDRLACVVRQSKRITLYSDYDVDGLSSAALLFRCLKANGGKVTAFLPDRMTEGYGLSRKGLERCLETTRPELLVVLDCGTNSRDEINELRRLGVETMVIDHHEPGNPAAPDILINPKLRNDDKNYTYFCTTGLVFKLCHAFLKKNPAAASKFNLKKHLDLAALATVADLVPLVGENRILVKHGLLQMHQTSHEGLCALKQVSGMLKKPTTYDCGFRLGPRLNAAGRLSSAEAALDLLITGDSSVALRIAVQLEQMNHERRALQQKIYQEALIMAQEQFHAGGKVLVVAQKGWHAGVVGIVASKLSQKFHRPAFVIAVDEKEGVGKGSGRSIDGFHLLDALNSARSFLAAGGGHTMAVGLTIEEHKISGFRDFINNRANQLGNPLLWQRCLTVDLELSLEEVRMDLLAELEQMEPFGQGNPPVLIALQGARVRRFQRVGEQRKHLSLVLENDSAQLRSIFFEFDQRNDPEIGKRVDVVFELQKDDYRGTANLQARLRDMAPVQ